jgi:hypothetical protein
MEEQSAFATNLFNALRPSNYKPNYVGEIEYKGLTIKYTEDPADDDVGYQGDVEILEVSCGGTVLDEDIYDAVMEKWGIEIMENITIDLRGVKGG